MKRFAATAVLLSYAAFGGFGFLLMAGMSHHDHVANCPFMPGEQVVCSMNSLEHASAWKGMLSATIPSFLAIIALFAVAITSKHLSELATSPPQAEAYFLKRSAVVVARSEYQLAFSQGIIHPKNP